MCYCGLLRLSCALSKVDGFRSEVKGIYLQVHDPSALHETVSRRTNQAEQPEIASLALNGSHQISPIESGT